MSFLAGLGRGNAVENSKIDQKSLNPSDTSSIRAPLEIPNDKSWPNPSYTSGNIRNPKFGNYSELSFLEGKLQPE